jgi:hypothetical protein
MSRQAVETLIDRWINEPAFREQLRTDPEGTVRASGAQLDEDEWAALRGVDWSLSDEELQSRASLY